LRSRVKRGPYLLLLEYLRQAGIAQAHLAPKTPLRQCLNEYREYLVRNRGLSGETIRRIIRVVRTFLSCRFGDGNVELSQPRSRDIVQYLLERSADLPLGRSEERYPPFDPSSVSCNSGETSLPSWWRACQRFPAGARKTYRRFLTQGKSPYSCSSATVKLPRDSAI
jgi:hypothetical protein